MAVYGSVTVVLACVVSVLLLATGNWEVLMAHHNLQPCFRCADIGFLLDMPGPPRGAHSVPQLTTSDNYGTAIIISAPNAQRQLDAAINRWLSSYEVHADWQTYSHLKDWKILLPVSESSSFAYHSIISKP